MSGQHFKPVFPPSSTPHAFKTGNFTLAMIKDSFKLPLIVATGAVVQISLSQLLPARWAYVPAAAVILNSIITTVVQCFQGNNAFTKYVVHGRKTTALPSADDGTQGPLPTKESFVVFNLGFQTNHPLGTLAPGMSSIQKVAGPMLESLMQRRDEYGLLSMSPWRGVDRDSHNTTLLTFYFKNVEGLHRFAHDELHRKAWDVWAKNEWKHMGIFHETFIVQPGGHETMYVNTHPVLFGRASFNVKSTQGQQYVNTMVSADTPALRTQWARLGRDADGLAKE